jgi:hypothetical protein
MKRTGVFVFVTLCCILSATAQEKPSMLTAPANWHFEQFALPPTFAPGIPYKGLEELRFSPGMFKKDSADYFTYVFVARLDNTPGIVQSDIKSYLLTYFKGLCFETAKNRKLSPVDTSAIRVSIRKMSVEERLYDIQLYVFGVFADGAPITLNMEAKAMSDVSGHKTYLLFIVSPQPKTAAVWKMLYAVQKEFAVPAHF